MINKKKGIFASIVVMVLQGGEGVIIAFFGLIAAFAGIIATPYFASSSLLAKELFTFILSALIVGNKNIVNIFKKGFTKSGGLYSIAFIIGSSIGSLFYILAISMAGSAYGTILTAMYPIFTTILLKMFLKEKSNYKVGIGIAFTIIGGILFLILPALLSQEQFTPTKIIGIALGALTALCWSIEGILLHVIRKRDQSGNDKDLAVGKSFVSLIFIATIIMPFTLIGGNSFKVFGNIMVSGKAIMIILALSINLIVLRLAYTYSIRNAGVRLTSIIDTNNFLVGPFISLILYHAAEMTYYNNPDKLLFEAIEGWSWLLIIPILAGVLMVIFNSKKEKEILDHEK